MAEPTKNEVKSFGLFAEMEAKGAKLGDNEKALINALDEKLYAAFNEAIAKEDSADYEKKFAELFTDAEAKLVSKEQYDSLLVAVKQEGLTLTGLKKNQTSTMKDGETMNFKQQFSQAVEEKKAEWEAMKGKKQPFEIEIKSAGTMLDSTVPTSPSSFVPAQTLIPGYVPYRTNTPLMLQYGNVMKASTPTINWIDETAGEGDAGWTAEGATKPLADLNVTARSVTAKKVAIAFKASEESLNDITFLMSLIENRGRKILNLKIDDGLINGDGTGEQPYGITYYAPSFTNTEMNDSVTAPNYYDAIAAASTQVLRANFQANTVFINPVDWFKMMHTKDAHQDYVLLQLQMSNGQFLEMNAVKSNQIPVGSFLVADMEFFMIAMLESMRVEVGWENDDFRKNLRTIIMEARLSSFVSENQKLAFVFDTYANVMAAIDATV